MSAPRRMLLRALGAAAAGGAAAGSWLRMGSSEAAAATALDASWRVRYDRPLALPGAGSWWSPLPAAQVSTLSVVPVQRALRGHLATPLWAYAAEAKGRTVLNPILIGRPGDAVRLRVHNRITQSTTIHWHGFAIDEQNDGGMGTAIEPGSMRDCDWLIRNAAGLNWYHPHAGGTSAEQVWRGLSGLFLVEDDVSDRLRRLLGVRFGWTDMPLVIQDRTIDRTGAMPYAAPSAPAWSTGPADPFAEAARASVCTTSAGTAAPMHGMHGKDILVNATRFPFVRLPRRWVRFRILNGSNARLYRLGFTQGNRMVGAALLGTDGALLAEPQPIRSIFLAPAQRIDIAIDLRQATPGDVWLKTLPFDPMHAESDPARTLQDTASSDRPHAHGEQGEGALEPVLRIEAVDTDEAPGALPPAIAEHRPPGHFEDTERHFTLGQDRRGQWSISGAFPASTAEAFRVQRGARETWVVHNPAAGMPHPMHLHGFSFNVLGRSGTPAQPNGWDPTHPSHLAQDRGRQDTVLVWPGETVRLGVDFAHPFAGPQRYMFHCHNLEHEVAGMMVGFGVHPRAA